MVPATRCLLSLALFAVATGACPTRVVDSVEIELQAVEVPGLALTMPAWTVHETGAQWQFGRHMLDEPGGRERFMEVQWTLATPTRLEDLAALYGPDFEISSREVGMVAGRDATTLLLAAPASGKHVAVTSWRCADDPRNFMLTSFLAREPAELLALYRRVLASVRCRPSPGGHPAPVFPIFAPPGSQRVDNPAAPLVLGTREEAYSLSAGLPGREALDKVATNAKFATTALGVEFPIDEVVLSGPTEGVDRRSWSGTARDETGEALRVALTVWYCPGVDLSFVGMFIGPWRSATPTPSLPSSPPPAHPRDCRRSGCSPRIAWGSCIMTSSRATCS